MTEPLSAARWLISGRVQGVGYRWFVLRRAEELGVGGWARNLPDGRVEVVASGPPEVLERLDAALRSGPRPAYVENVDKADIPHHTVGANGFYIR